MLPGCLNFFQNWDGKCEHAIKTCRPILLEWADPKHSLERTMTDELEDAQIGAGFEEEGDFFDFTQNLRTPDCLIQFTNMRVLQTICLLPNMHLLIEGLLMSQTVEVYEIRVDQGRP